MTQRSYSMADAYRSIYEPTTQETISIEDVIDTLVEGGLLQEEEKMSAFDFVKKQITDKYGEGAIIDTSKPKKQISPEERKKDMARRAKNWAEAQKAKNENPYRARPGESD